MADIDDELLALAGSDEDESGTEREPSRSPEPRPRGETKLREASAKKGKRRGRNDDSDEEEEGEASSDPGTPNSLESAPMEESDSDNDEPQPRRPDLSALTAAAAAAANASAAAAAAAAATVDEGEKYPVEGLYISIAEKEEIMRMREVERETILAERRDEAQRYKQNRLLRQLVSAQEEKEKEQQRRKRTADEADIDDDGRKPSRQRTKGAETASSGIDTLRRQRAEKNDRLRRREEDREKEKSTPRKSGRLQDAYGDEEDDWTRQKSPEPEKRGRPDAELADFQRLRIARTNFPEICFKPGFEKAIVDCYVRVLGKPLPGQQPKYHMLPVKSITTGKGYAIDDTATKKQIVVDMYFIAGIGKRTETYPFIAASTGRFTQEELEDYKRLLQDRGLSFPKQSALDAKLDELRNLVKYTLTNEEITEMVNRKAHLRNRYDPNIRAQLERSLEEAKADSNTIYARQLQDELDSLGQGGNLAFKTSLDGIGSGSSSTPRTNPQQDRLAQLNAENRRRNAEAVRRALLQERHRQREIEQRLARGETVEDDLSRRLKTRAKFVFDPNETPKQSRPGSGASTPANGTPKLTPRKGLPEVQRLQERKFAETKGVPTVHKPLDDDDIIASLDLDIDADI